ncbi:MAG: UxaA family hydrolase [Candidatus Methanosuratus sp.]|nr:UxaA family hydrolase [Candidatus Methanosuratincola sp.]
MAIGRAIMVDESDNVATALTDLKKDAVVEAGIGQTSYKIKLRSDITFGHKFALKRILKGEHVIKYGEVIGRASKDIEVGDHVHVHNTESLRARGDLKNRNACSE